MVNPMRRSDHDDQTRFIKPHSNRFRDPISVLYLKATCLSWVLILIEGGRAKPDFVSGTFLLAFYIAVRVITVGMGVLMPAMLVWRVRRVLRVLQNGAVTTGRIKIIRSFFRDSLITVEFPCCGQAATARIALSRKKAKKWGLGKDDEIGLVVDETVPRDALIRRLYC